MADTIRRVDYFKIKAANRAGEGARVLGALRRAKVNLLAFSGFPRSGAAQIDLVPANTAAFKRAAQRAKLRLSLAKKGFLVQGTDRVGAVFGILDKLGRAKINVTAIDAVSAGKGRYGAIFWVKPKDMGRASRVLRAR